MNDTVERFKQQYPNGFEGTILEGMKVIGKWLPPRVTAVIRAVEMLEKNFGKITWHSMSFDLVETHGRYGHGSMVGGQQVMSGITESGETVQYRYVQPPSAEGGRRVYKHGKMAWTPMSKLVG